MVQLINNLKSGELQSRFFGILNKDLSVGTLVTFKGITTKNCNRFTLNFFNAKKVDSDISLHVDVRFTNKVVVRNSNIDGGWMDEERWSDCNTFDFKTDYFFDIKILIAETEFMIFVYDKHFCDFQYRCLTSLIKAVEVRGDVCCSIVDIDEIKSIDIQRPIPLNGKIEYTNHKEGRMIFSLPQKFTEGYTLQISGRVKDEPVSFSMNLQNSARQWPYSDIVYSFKPLFGESDDDLITQNTRLSNIWCKARNETKPKDLAPGEVFHLLVRCLNDGIGVWINFIHWKTYAHRINPENIDTLLLEGDMEVYSLTEEYIKE